MTERDDDLDALTWAGDEEPIAERAVEPTETRTVVVDTPEAPATPGILIVTYGILAGIYVLFTAGWIGSVIRLNELRGTFSDLLSEIMFQFGEFLAIASPGLWFVTALVLTRGRRPIVRLALLLLGLVVVVPWPFVLGV